MSNRQYQQKEYGFLRKLIRLYPVVAVGDNGAVTLKSRSLSAVGTNNSPTYSLVSAPTSGVGYAYSDGGGVRKVVRNGTGDWTFTLNDSYLYLVGITCVQISNTTGAVTSPVGTIGIVSGSTNVQTNTALGNGGTIRIILSSASATAADPASGDTLTFQIILGDTSAL